MSRQKSKRHFPEGFEATEEEIRFGTPIEVAEYRARRLKCDTLVEIGCGVGFNTLYFAKYCKKVIAVEIDSERLERAKRNLAKYKISNVEFHAVDALDKTFISSLSKIDIIFCDPGRPERGERTQDILSPGIDELRNAYNSVCENIAYECPPYLQDVPKDTEREFISLNGELNRLMLYFGRCKERALSLIDLPSGERLQEKKEKSPKVIEAAYIGEVSQAVSRAGMAEALASLGELVKEDTKLLIQADSPTPSAFVRWYHKVKCKKGSDVVLHYPIEQGKYKEEKRKFKIAKGDEPLHVFKVNGEIIFCERHKL